MQAIVILCWWGGSYF